MTSTAAFADTSLTSANPAHGFWATCASKFGRLFQTETRHRYQPPNFDNDAVTRRVLKEQRDAYGPVSDRVLDELLDDGR